MGLKFIENKPKIRVEPLDIGGDLVGLVREPLWMGSPSWIAAVCLHLTWDSSYSYCAVEDRHKDGKVT